MKKKGKNKKRNESRKIEISTKVQAMYKNDYYYISSFVN